MGRLRLALIKALALLAICCQGCFVREYHCTQMVEQYKDEAYNDTFLRSYEDKNNHNTLTVVLKEGGKTFEITSHCLAIKKAFWNHLQAGDSIYKPLGSTKFQVFRKNQLLLDVDVSTLEF